MQNLGKEDSYFLSILRATMIVAMVFCHVSGMWFWRPYSEFLAVVVPVFFFLSGAVSYPSFKRSPSTYEYFEKRILQLLTPYYLMCVLCLIVFVVVHQSVPEFSATKFIRWVTITPHQDMMPFPLIQVWFLHCSVVLSVVSFAIFRSYDRNSNSIFLFAAVAILASCLQLRYDIGSRMDFSGHNLFRPLVYSLLFCLGFFFFQTEILRRRVITWGIFIGGVGLSVGIVKAGNIDPDYALHMPNPDVYFLSGCIAFIALLVTFRTGIVATVSRIPGSSSMVNFLVRHTFAIFLLHTFSIFLVERLTAFGSLQRMTIPLGLAKFTAVLFLTLVLAVPFTWMSKAVEGSLSRWRLGRRTAGC